MNIILPIDTPHGVIYVEVTEGELKARVGQEAGRSYAPDNAELTGVRSYLGDTLLSGLRANISAIAAEVNTAFAGIAPAEWSVEVNIGFKGKANPIPVIVSGEAEASLKVVAKWKKA